MKKAPTKVTLLLAATMTVMAGAIVAPSLPNISKVFADTPHIALLSKLVITLPALFIAIFSPPAGKIADRLGRMPLLLGSLLLYAVGGTSAYLFNDIYLILLSRAILGIAIAGTMTSVVTLAGDYFEGGERKSFLGLQGAFMAMGGVVFVMLGGVLADISWRAPFLIYLLSLPVAVVAFYVLSEPQVQEEEQQNSVSHGFNALPRIAWLIYGNIFLGMILFYMVPVQIPFLLKDLNIEQNYLSGVAIGIGTFFSAVTSISYRKLSQKLSFPAFFAIAYLLIGGGYGLVSLANGLVLVIAGLVVSGSGIGLLIPNTNIWLLAILPEQIRGFGTGISGTFLFIGQFLSPIAVRPLVEAFSLSAAFGYAVLPAIVLSLTFALLHFRTRKQKLQLA
jgi:MFS family permease